MPRRGKHTIGSLRIPLSPCDYHFLVIQRCLTRRDASREVSFITLDLDGQPDPDRVRTAFRRVLAAHPATRGRIRYSLLLGRPHWRVEPDDSPLNHAYSHHDLRDASDADARVHARIERAIDTPWGFRRPPLIRIDHFDLPGHRSHLCLQWPHGLMDAEGAHRSLREMARLDRAPDSPPPADLLDPCSAPDPLAGVSWLSRWRLFREGLREQSALTKTSTAPLPTGTLNEQRPHRFLTRLGSLERSEQIRANAKRLTPPGAGLYVRYLAACTLRALKRLYRNHGVDSENYMIAYPMRVSSVGAKRPLTGNYVVAPTLTATASQIEDRAALSEHIRRQVEAFRSRRADIKQWAVLWMAGKMRPGVYHRVMQGPIGRVSILSGFAYYQADADPGWTALAGAEITGFRMGGLVRFAPGWNVVFCRYRDRLTFNLSWVDGRHDESTAHEYADLIEAEVLQD